MNKHTKGISYGIVAILLGIQLFYFTRIYGEVAEQLQATTIRVEKSKSKLHLLETLKGEEALEETLQVKELLLKGKRQLLPSPIEDKVEKQQLLNSLKVYPISEIRIEEIEEVREEQILRRQYLVSYRSSLKISKQIIHQLIHPRVLQRLKGITFKMIDKPEPLIEEKIIETTLKIDCYYKVEEQ